MNEQIILEDFHSPLDGLDRFSSDLHKLTYRIKGFTVTDRESSTQALDIAAECRNRRDELETIRKKAVEPARKHIAMINESAKAVAEKYLELEQAVTKELELYQNVLKEEHEKAQKSANEFVESFGIDMTVLVPKMPKATSAFATIAEKTKKTFEIEDINLIPREYLEVNEKMIQKLINAGITNIPGIKITQEKVMTIRRK